jgi:hypothetical protein
MSSQFQAGPFDLYLSTNWAVGSAAIHVIARYHIATLGAVAQWQKDARGAMPPCSNLFSSVWPKIRRPAGQPAAAQLAGSAIDAQQRNSQRPEARGSGRPRPPRSPQSPIFGAQGGQQVMDSPLMWRDG